MNVREITLSRRRILASLAGASALLPLAACGTVTPATGETEAKMEEKAAPAKEEPKEPEVQVAKWFTASYGGGSFDPVQQGLVDSFNELDATLQAEYVIVPGNQQACIEKVRTGLAAGERDIGIFNCSPIWLANIGTAGLAAELDSLIARDQVDLTEYADLAIDAHRLQGNLVAIPHYVNSLIVVYNKDLMNKLGEEVPVDSWTWDDFLTLARRLTTGAGAQKQFGVATVPRGFNPNTPWIWMAGGSTYDDEENPTKSTMSSIETRAGLQWRADLYHKHQVTPRPGEVEGDLFSGGVSPLIVTTGAAMSRYRGDRVSFAWDVVGIPAGPTGRTTFAGSYAQAMYSESSTRDAAWGLLKHVTGRPGALAMLSVSLSVPVYTPVAQNEYRNADGQPDGIDNVLNFLTYLRGLPKNPNMIAIYGPAYGTHLGKIWTGEMSVEEATAAMDTIVDGELG